MTHPAFTAHPSVDVAPPLRAGPDAGLKELIRGDAEEIGDTVEIVEREFAAVLFEDFREPGLALIAPLCQVLPGFPLELQERINIRFDESMGFHGRIKAYHA